MFRLTVGAAHLASVFALAGALSCLGGELPVETFFRNFQHRSAAISPDGNSVAVLAPVQQRIGLAVIDLATGAANWAFSDATADVVWFKWANSERLLLQLGRDGYASPGLMAVNRDSTKPVTLIRIGTRGSRFLGLLPHSPDEILVYSLAHGQRPSDTLLVFPGVDRMNLYTGASELAVRNPGRVVQWLLDHEGVVRVGVAIENEKLRVLYRDKEGGPWATLAEYTQSEKGIWPEGLAYDNRTLFVRAYGDANTEGIYTYDPQRKQIKELAFRHAEADVESLRFSDAKRALVGVSFQTERPEVFWFDADFRRYQALVDASLTNSLNQLVSSSQDAKRLVFHASSDRTPGSFYLLETDQPRLRKICDVAEWIRPEQMAEMKPIVFTSRDGLKLHGYLTTPQGCPARNLPMIVCPHGGPSARNSWGFDQEVQFLANRGYAVLQVNFRGSTGYGRSFYEAGFRQWGLKQQDDITDGVKWAIEQGIADAKRIGIYGGSYGGFAALTGLEKTPELYRCGISLAGVSDIGRTINPPFTPQLLITKAFISETVGDPKDDKELLKELSPLNHVDDIKAPVFLAYGELDSQVPIRTGRALAKALKKQGKLHTLMIKADEGHGFHREANRIEFWSKVDDFLKANLR